MTDACPIPTPAQRRYYDALDDAKQIAFDKITAAIEEARATAAQSFEENGIEGSPPSYDYFVFGFQQQMYCILCGADPHSFEGGDPAMAINIIRNGQNIAKRYWGANIEPYPWPSAASPLRSEGSAHDTGGSTGSRPA